MITEIVQGLDEMFRESEVLFHNKILSAVKYVGHLERDGLDQAFRVLSKFLVLRRQHPILWLQDQDLLNFLQSVDTTKRIAAQNARYGDGNVVRPSIERDIIICSMNLDICMVVILFFQLLFGFDSETLSSRGLGLRWPIGWYR